VSSARGGGSRQRIRRHIRPRTRPSQDDAVLISYPADQNRFNVAHEEGQAPPIRTSHADAEPDKETVPNTVDGKHNIIHKELEERDVAQAIPRPAPLFAFEAGISMKPQQEDPPATSSILPTASSVCRSLGPDEWQNARELITRLYVTEDWPLRTVRRIMADNHDFHAT